MNSRLIATMTISMLILLPAYAANPFLDAKDDKPVSANFRGTEWSDDFPDEIPHEIPLTARMVTTRVAKTPWGAIFKIEFIDLKSRAPQPRRNQPGPDWFIVTDERIAVLNTELYVHSESGVRTMQQVEEDNEAAVKKISAMDKAPTFEDGDVRGITSGKLDHEEGPWTTTINVKGDECTYLTSHNSGHFSKIVWKKGVGLVEFAQNYGAEREGFRLKRTATSQKR